MTPGAASRTPEAAAGLGPASRVIRQGNDGAAARTPPDAPPTGRTHTYELLHLGDTDLLASLGPCLVAISTRMTRDAVDAMAGGMAKLAQDYGKLSLLAFIEGKSGPNMGSEERDAMTVLIRKHSHDITGAAVVCAGTGFRATAIRSLVTAIHMASRPSHAAKVFAADVPAVEWLASTRSDDALDVRLLLEACAGLRAKLHERLARAAARDGG